MKHSINPQKSLILVEFENFFKPLAYYNDKFDLEVGDIVYVDGKLEGEQGRVIEISYSFNIKINDYKKIIAAADTSLCGELHMRGKYGLDPTGEVLPAEKVRTWFRSPSEVTESILSREGKTFQLDDEKNWPFKEEVRERGEKLFSTDKVVYLSVRDNCVFAIVQGSDYYYEVMIPVSRNQNNFDFYVSVCDCMCFGACKHQYAVLKQLKELLQTEIIDLDKQEDFAVINTDLLYKYTIMGKKQGSLIFGNHI